MISAFWLLSLFSVPCFAQEPKPYASINRDAVNYNGPGRDARHDIVQSEIRLGLLAPLTGRRQAEGEALRRAVEMAIEEENLTPLPEGRRLVLVARDENGPWGQAATEIVHFVYDDQAVALITSPEGGSAHLAEQVANKIGVPILTLSTDATTTEINLPWIFRLGPTDAAQAQAFARDIYKKQGFERVALLTQDDHDGRKGGEEFEKAARQMGAPAPTRINVDPEKPLADTWQEDLRGAQAVVMWTDTATADPLVARVREELPSVPLYLCRKAAQGNWGSLSQPRCRACAGEDAEIWTVDATGSRPEAYVVFAQRYRQRFGVQPYPCGAQAYDAVRLLAASLRASGPNRARLRDTLAEVSGFSGASGIISFDHAGNDLTSVTLTRLPRTRAGAAP